MGTVYYCSFIAFQRINPSLSRERMHVHHSRVTTRCEENNVTCEK